MAQSIQNNAAIEFRPEAFQTAAPRLMGRQAAGEGFLRAMARHANADTLFCYASTDDDFEVFREQVLEANGSRQGFEWIRSGDLRGLSRPGCLYTSTPNLGDRAWLRRSYDATAYSLCGVTHTTASHRIMDALGNLLVAPLQSWDAVVCTSGAVKRMVEHIIQDWGAYLGARFESKARNVVQMPVIPLGVDCASFARTPRSAALRKRLREQLGIAEDEIAVLYLGRLSFHAKAHPLPMYAALEAAAKQTGKRVCLLQAGWFASDTDAQSFQSAAKEFAPSLRVHFVDGRAPRVREAIWFAADVFTSLADNVQETFGQTPVEAMAAGLPMVVSDWNGYRETVRHGVDGFLIPTIMPPPETGAVIARRHAMGFDSYDRYIGRASQSTAVDLRACTQAYARCLSDADLRQSLGEAGRARAESCYDWAHIIATYQQLWAELGQRRRKDRESAPRRSGQPHNPLRNDPFTLFTGYPTRLLDRDTTFEPCGEADTITLERLWADRLTNVSSDLMLPIETCAEILEHIRRQGRCSVADLVERFTLQEQYETLLRTLGWLVKFGLLAVQD